MKQLSDFILNEASRSEKDKELKKSMLAITGKLSNIHTILIMSPQNPLGVKADHNYNRNAKKGFEKMLKDGFYAFHKVLGKYGQYEESYFVYNISFKDAESLNLRYKQDSFIFITNSDGTLTFDVYKHREGNDGPYYENTGSFTGKVSNEREADDFFTKIGKKFKFSIPFDASVFESMSRFLDDYNDVVENCGEDYKALIAETLDNNFTGNAKFTRRRLLYGMK